MPGLDGTGPWGEGPMTGGGRGFCNPAWAGYRPRFSWYRGFGRGFGRWPGWGRGYGRRAFYPGWGGGYPPAYAPPYPMAPSEEIEMLKAEAASIKSGLDEINKRIEELEKESSGS